MNRPFYSSFTWRVVRAPDRMLRIRARQVLSWRKKPLEELPDSLQRLVAMRAPHAAECKLCQHVIQHRVARADS